MNELATDGPSHAVDSLVRDGCESISAKGQIPDTRAVRDFCQVIVERQDRRRAEQPPRIKRSVEQRSHAAEKPDDAIIREAKRRLEWRGLEPMFDYEDVRISRRAIGMDDLKPKPKPKVEGMSQYSVTRLIERIGLIRQTEDYRLRGETINPMAMSGELGPEKQLEAMNHWKQLILDSEKHFGPWWKEPPKRLFFS